MKFQDMTLMFPFREEESVLPGHLVSVSGQTVSVHLFKTRRFGEVFNEISALRGDMTLLVLTVHLLQEKISCWCCVHRPVSHRGPEPYLSLLLRTCRNRHRPPSVSMEDLCLWCWSRA